MGGVHPEVQRGTSSVDGAVERVSRLVDLDGGFIHAGGVMSYFELWPAALIEFRGIALDPTTYCCMINRDLAFPQEFFHIPVASGIAQKPADCTADHLGRAKAPCEQGRMAHRRSPVVWDRYGRAYWSRAPASLAIEPVHLRKIDLKYYLFLSLTINQYLRQLPRAEGGLYGMNTSYASHLVEHLRQ